jgi:hypothetical protein
MDNSLDSMIETFNEIKETIDDAMNNFRRKNLTLIHKGKEKALTENWQLAQISISGTDVWRRVIVPGNRLLEDLHRLIQICLGWEGHYRHCFFTEGPGGMDRNNLDDKMKIWEVCDRGISELQYEYGTKWNIKVIFLSPYQAGKEETIRCVAGECAAPPEATSGPLRFRKMLGMLEGNSAVERQNALLELGADFSPNLFDMEKCNRDINSGRI